MSWQNVIIVNLTLLSACMVSVSTIWIDIPQHWQPSFFAGIPSAVCLLATIFSYVGKAFRLHRSSHIEPTELDQYLVSVKHIDQEWHQALELTARLRQEGEDLFDKINQQLYVLYGPKVATLEGWHYKVITEMVADSLRILDSVLSQCRSGHPDTALATARQLFELMMFQQVIALDPSGATAKKYQDITEMKFLQKSIEIRGADYVQLVQLRRLRDEYPSDLKVKPPFSWIVLPGGKSLGNMEEVIEHVVGRQHQGEETQSAKRDAEAGLSYYMHQWFTLNNWVHISKSASRRKLGIRTVDGYLQAHLFEKSRVGLESPLSLSVSFSQIILETLEHAAYTRTDERHEEDLQGIANTVREIGLAFDSVPAELLANDFRLGRFLSETPADTEVSTRDG